MYEGKFIRNLLEIFDLENEERQKAKGERSEFEPSIGDVDLNYQIKYIQDTLSGMLGEI